MFLSVACTTTIYIDIILPIWRYLVEDEWHEIGPLALLTALLAQWISLNRLRWLMHKYVSSLNDHYDKRS